MFGRSALTISEVSLDDHDRLIAESLGLSHAVNLLFLGALTATHLSAPELARAASTTFHRQSSLARSVAQEGAELYLEIPSLNPHSRDVYRTLEARLGELREIVRAKDLVRFRDWLDRGRGLLDGGPPPMRA
jgi:prephenate dehydrogenase